MKILGTLFLIFYVAQARAALSSEAKAYLAKTPENQLTLPFVMEMAFRNAEAFQVLGLEYATAELEERGQITSLTDTYFTAGGSFVDDHSAKTNAFQPLRAQQWEWNAGLSKKWSTGTETSVGWVYDTNELEFAPLGGLSDQFLRQFKQSAAVINISQNLLRDSFGYGFRNQRLGAQKRGEAIQWRTREELESLSLQFINQYYSSWLMQQRVASLSEQVSRQQRLVRILTGRANKGAVERPELIQVQALLASTETRFRLAKAQLAGQWEQLVVSLKLPPIFLEADPMEIPTTIDNPVELGLRVCGLKEPKKTATVAVLEASLDALKADLKAAKSGVLPDLKLVAGYRGNSIDNEASVTVQNVLEGTNGRGFGAGTSWNVGLLLNWPLNNDAAHAKATQTFIQHEQTAARLRMASDNLQTEWRDACRRLKVEAKNAELYQKVVDDQKRRVKAEERRFSLGRSSVDQLVTSENDLSEWEFTSQQKSIEVRQMAWQVQRYAGELYKTLEPYVDSMLSREITQ